MWKIKVQYHNQAYLTGEKKLAMRRSIKKRPKDYEYYNTLAKTEGVIVTVCVRRPAGTLPLVSWWGHIQ